MISFRVGLLLLIFVLQIISVTLYSTYPETTAQEHFILKRERREGGDITIGVLPNTPPALQNAMANLNMVGMQAEADAKYDVVDSKILNKAK